MLLRRLLELQINPVRIPLRWLLVIPFVLQTVGATALVGYLSYRSGQEAVENLANQLLRQTSERVSDRLSSYLQTPQNIVAANHLAVGQGTLDVNNPEQLRRHLWQQIILNQSIPSVLFWSEQGDGIGYGRISSQEQNFARELTGKKFPIGTVYLYKLIPNLRRYYLVDPQGKPQKLVYTFKDDFRKLTWYRQVKAVGKQHWTPVFVGRILPSLQIMAVSPIYNATGKSQGLFTCSYLLAEFSNFLNHLRFSPTGKIFIIDKSGNLIATSVLSEATGTRLVNWKPDTPNATLRERLPAVNSLDKVTQKVSQKLLQKFGSFYNLKEAKQLSLQVNHHQDFVQVTPFKDKYGLDWLVVTVIPESDFMTEIQNNNRTTVLLCLLTLGMAIACGLIITNRFTTRIARLNQVSQKLAAGDLTQRLPVDSSIVEVQQLGQSFNLMADQLQQSFDRLHNALEKSEEKFTTIFRASPDAICITDAEGRFIEVNNRMLELYGYSREEMIGRSALELGLWTNLKQREQFKHLLATQGWAYNIEVLSQAKTGEIKTLLLAAEACHLEGKSAVIVIIRDISDRARLETALRQSEAKFQELAAASPAIIFSLTVDPQGKFQYEYLNPVAEVIHEVPLAELLRDGSWARNQTHPDDLAQFQQAVAYSMKTMQPFENERRIITPSGKIKWLSVNARCQQRETGQVVWHGIAIDITDRKQAEIALLQSELKFATMFLDSPQPAWIATLAEGRCIDVNDSFSKVLGYSRIQAIGKTCVEMQLWTDLADFQHFRASVLKYGRIDNFEIRFRTRSGEIKTVLLSAKVSYLDEQDCVIGVLSDISDRKAAEIALGRYERIVCATTDGIALVDRHYHYQIVNQTYLNWQNKSRSEVIGHSICEIMGEEVFQTVIKPRIDRCFRGETIEYTGWLTLAGIGRQFLSASYIPYLDADGSISSVLVSVRNITPLKQAEVALSQSEQKFRGAFDSVSAGMALVSPAGGFLEVNAALCQMLSYSEDELLQLRLEDIEHPDDRQTDADWIEPIFFCEFCTHQVEKRFLSKQGQTIWGLMNRAVMQDAQADPLYLIVQIANITDRKQAEIARQESETRLRLALEVSGAIAWERDLETNELVFSNTITSQISEKISYLQAMALVHPDDRVALNRANQEAIAQRGTFQIEHRVATSLQNLEWRWLQVSARVMTDITGKPTRMIGMSVDITDRRKLDIIKDEFISIVSHELRTPLTSLRGSLGILESGILKDKPDKAQRMLQVALNNTDRLVRLVNDILDLQRLESNQVPLVKEICQVSNLIEQAVESVQAIAHQANITIKRTSLNASVQVSADEIIQTLINLLGNAIKFSPPESTIWLEAELINNCDPANATLRERRTLAKFPYLEDLTPTSHILFSITDQGRGIPRDKLESIFGRFQQVDSSDSRSKGGTGLGLAICKNIVQRHQGLIWAESVIGQGSTFYFTLPMGD